MFFLYYGGFLQLCIAEPKAGKWLADGYFGSMWALLGDQDHKRDAYRMANVNSNTPCTQGSLFNAIRFCLGRLSGAIFKDFHLAKST